MTSKSAHKSLEEEVSVDASAGKKTQLLSTARDFFSEQPVITKLHLNGDGTMVRIEDIGKTPKQIIPYL